MKRYEKKATIIFGILLCIIWLVWFFSIVMSYIPGPLDESALSAISTKYSGCTILDHGTVGDSTLLLVQTTDQNVYLLKFQDIPLLSCSVLQSECLIPSSELEFHTAVQTAFACYPVCVQNLQELSLNGTMDLTRQPLFWKVYVFPLFLLFAAGFTVYCIIKAWKTQAIT